MEHKQREIKSVQNFGTSGLPLLHFVAENNKEKMLILLIKVKNQYKHKKPLMGSLRARLI
jgi:hypothetical protein